MGTGSCICFDHYEFISTTVYIKSLWCFYNQFIVVWYDMYIIYTCEYDINYTLCTDSFRSFLAHKIDEGHKHVLHLQDTWDRVFRSRWGSSWWVWKKLGPKAAVVDFSELFIVFKASTGRFCKYFNDRGDRRSLRKHCHGAFGISSFTVRSVRGLVILIIVNFILMLLQVQCGSRSRLAIGFVYIYIYIYR